MPPPNQATFLPFNVTEAPGPLLSITDPTRKIVYCPHDTPWKAIRDLEALITQCRMRSLSDDGDVSTLQQRLGEYQKAHKHENEARAGLWRPVPDYSWNLANETIISCQLIQVRDTSDVSLRWFEKLFTLHHSKSAGTFTVVISKDLTCNCKTKTISVNGKYTCEHILYVLRYVLRCPEPLLYQTAFLSVELEYIFAANPFFSWFPNKTPVRLLQDEVDPYPACAICFRSIPIYNNQSALLECGRCEHFAHGGCFEIFHNIRRPSQPQSRICVLCEDEKEWLLPELEPAPGTQSQDPTVAKEEEAGNEPPVPVYQTKLVAMLYYETRGRRRSDH